MNDERTNLDLKLFRNETIWIELDTEIEKPIQQKQQQKKKMAKEKIKAETTFYLCFSVYIFSLIYDVRQMQTASAKS